LPSSVARLLHNAGYRLLRRFEDAYSSKALRLCYR
jgi:hypothetical protein